MPAIRGATVVPKAPNLWKTLFQRFGGKAPEPDFAKSGRIDDETAVGVGEWEHQRTDGRVASLVHRLTDVADTKIRTREERVEQRGFADARRPSENRSASGK